jgi:hypothetical protein
MASFHRYDRCDLQRHPSIGVVQIPPHEIEHDGQMALYAMKFESPTLVIRRMDQLFSSPKKNKIRHI